MSKIMKGFTCQLVAQALLFTTISPIYAQANGGAILSALNGVADVAQQMAGQQQMLQQQAAFAQQMSKFDPRNQLNPSKFFPNCPIVKSRTDFPTGVCEAPPQVGDPMGTMQLTAMRDAADNFSNYIANLMAPAQNSGRPVGLQCIKESIIDVDTQILNKINALTAQIGQVKKANQLFKENNKKILENMDMIAGDLYGGATNKKDQSKDMLKEFSYGCRQKFFGSTTRTHLRRGGFAGLRDQMASIKEDATNAKNNEANMKKKVMTQINELDRQIKSKGIAAIQSSEQAIRMMRVGGDNTEFKVMNNLIANKLDIFNDDFVNIQRDLKDVGFDINRNELDRNFQDRFSDFAKNAKSYFQREAVDRCVTGRDRTTLTLGLSKDEVLNSLRMRDVSGNQTSLRGYRAELETIWESDEFIDRKMELIRALDSKYGIGEVKLKYTNASGKITSSTTYGYFQELISACEVKIQNDDTLSTNSNKRLKKSYKQRIDRASKAMNRLITLERDFRTNIKQALYGRVVNCSGITLKEEDCSQKSLQGSNGILSDSHDNYCVANALTCAKRVDRCNGEVETIVQKKQAQMQTLATQYNANVSGLVAQQEGLLNQIKSMAITDAEYLKKFFPGSNYEFPKDLFVKMPGEEMVDKYGVALRGKGNMSRLDDLPRQLDKVKKMLEKQRGSVASTLKQYLADQRTALSNEKKRWDKLAGDCKNMEMAYNQAAAEAMQQQQEQMANTSAFCRRYDAIAQNPGPGCGLASSLAEAAAQASGQINPEALGLAESYSGYCASIQNEESDNMESGESRPVRTSMRTKMERAYKLCSENGHQWSNVTIDYADIIAPIQQQGGYDAALASQEYCQAFGQDFENDKCVKRANDDIDACSYINHLAKANYDGKKEDLFAALDNSESAVRKDPFMQLFASYYHAQQQRVKRSPSGQIGEVMRDTPCLAVNQAQYGEQQQTGEQSIIDSIMGNIQ